MRIICFSLLCLLPVKLWAFDTLRIQSGFSKANVLNHALFITTKKEVSVNEIAGLLTDPGQFSVLDRANQGYSDKIIWVVIPISIETSHQNLLIEIQNPQLDHIAAFLLQPRGAYPLGEPTGDEHLFNTRNMSHRNFIWRLPETNHAQNTILIFRIEKLNSSLVLPFFIWDAGAFQLRETKILVFYGACFGVMLLVMLYSLGIGILLKQRIQFLYVGLIGTAILYFLIAEGFASQFIYPNVPGINGFMRLIIIALNTSAFILFSRSFLNIHQYHRRISQVLVALVGLMLTMVLLTPLINQFYLTYSSFFVPFILAISLLGNFLPLAVAFTTFKKQQETSTFFLLAYSAILLTSTLVRLEDIGWLERFDLNPNYAGAFIENMIFFVALGYRTKKVYDQRNEFSLRISKHQKEMMQSYVRGTEQERQRVARDLHDDIGSRMSHVKRLIENKNHNDLLHQVDTLCTDIRNLSHQLAPQSIQFNSLAQMIEQQVYLMHQAGISVNFLQYDFSDDITPEIKAELFRIVQEACNNILKHSGAKNTDIQLFKHDTQLVITIEDDGHGFDEQSLKVGIGLANMRARTESLDGSFEISSKPGSGTSIMLSIPYSTRSQVPD